MFVQTVSESTLLIVVSLVAALTGVAIIRRHDRKTSQAGAQIGAETTQSARLPSDAICQDAPFPTWAVTHGGEVVWANQAYRKLARSDAVDALVFPIPAQKGTRQTRFRAELHRPGAQSPDRFQVTAVAADVGWHAFAIPDSLLEYSDASNHEMTQTLAKTFAQLSTGLAIFDAQKRLQLFNPALVDLCGLPVDFLSARPDLATFFDALRDRQMMPEPRNYSTWRDHIADLAAAAASGRYQETWTLSSGSVYEVIGRPHPGGAIAFLFQDISAEVTLTRQFRSDLDQYHAIFEALDTPLCVVSEAGNLSFANAAYTRFWRLGEGEIVVGLSVDQLCQNWCGASAERSRVRDIRARLIDPDINPENVVPLSNLAGRSVSCQMHPLPGGSVLLRFLESAPETVRPQFAVQEFQQQA